MCFLAEMLAVMVLWMSFVALGQFGVVVDKAPPSPLSQERTVPRSPRASIIVPVAVIPCSEPPSVA